MDFIVDLPPSQEASNILGITDRLSKNQILIPCPDITALTVTRLFLIHVFAHHGLPRSIVSDRGPQFTGLFWKEICRQLDITRRLSTAFHPSTDGAQERSNQEIETYLRSFCAYAQNDWADLLPQAQFALNNRVTSGTGLSPFFFTHGYHGELIQQATSDAPLGGSRISLAAAADR